MTIQKIQLKGLNYVDAVRLAEKLIEVYYNVEMVKDEGTYSIEASMESEDSKAQSLNQTHLHLR